MTGTQYIPTSHVYSTDKSELEEFLVDKKISQFYYTDEEKSKGIIFDENSTEESKSECIDKNVNKEKYTNNEAEYEEPSVTHEVPSYFNIIGCGENLLNRLDVAYERVYKATPKDKYYEKMLENLVDYNDRNDKHFPMRSLYKQ